MSLKIVFICICVCLLLVFSSCGIYDFNVYMYSDIEECFSIQTDNPNGVNVLISEADFYDYPYEQTYAYDYISENLQFTFYAYQFADWETANSYYEDVIGRSNDLKTAFLDSSGAQNFRRVVICDNNVYVVYSGTEDREDVIAFLSKIFTVKIY